MRALILLTLVFLAFSSACEPPEATQLTLAEREAISDTIRQLADQFFADFNALDFDAAMAPFSSDLVWAEQGHMGANRDSLDVAWRGVFESIQEVTSGDWTEVHIRVLGPDAAVFNGSFDWHGTGVNSEAVGGPGVWTTVWVRTDQGWQIVHGHESYAMPEPEGM
jgi:uncharacterized protein (TIGR02246 family)